MKERPILFNGEMVRAIQDGRKTQTRRVIKPQPEGPVVWKSGYDLGGESIPPGWIDERPSMAFQKKIICPYGVPGDRLWVRETWAVEIFSVDHTVRVDTVMRYRADGERKDIFGANKKWRPSIHMPLWASRIDLEITGIRVERLQDITEEDAISEGSQIPCSELPKACQQGAWTERQQFSRIWDSTTKKHPWSSNPWVWVIEFLQRQLETPQPV